VGVDVTRSATGHAAALIDERFMTLGEGRRFPPGAARPGLDRELDPLTRARFVHALLERLEVVLAADADAAAVRASGGPVVDTVVPVEGRPVDIVLDEVISVLESSGVNTRSPRYFGYLPAGGLFTSALGSFLAAALNPYSAMGSVSPGAVQLETLVVRWLCDVVGLPAEGSGVLTSGGSSATLTAVIAAREAFGITARRVGRCVAYVGEHRHVSVDRALRFAGLGECVLRVVPSGPGYRMDPGALASALDADASAGLTPWLVVPTAGTTSSGSIDPLADIVTEAHRHSAWVHVDAAYGGLFALAESARPLLAGLGAADSVAVDPHKALFLPYGTGALLARDHDLLRAAFAHSAEYLEQDPRSAFVDSPADLGIELTRPFRALNVWLPLQLNGCAAFAEALESRLRLARHAHGLLRACADLDVGSRPDLTVVTYRAKAAAATESASLNTALARRLREDGRVFVTTTRLDGRLTLRFAVGSPHTRAEDVEEAVDRIVCAARSLTRP